MAVSVSLFVVVGIVDAHLDHWWSFVADPEPTEVTSTSAGVVDTRSVSSWTDVELRSRFEFGDSPGLLLVLDYSKHLAHVSLFPSETPGKFVSNKSVIKLTFQIRSPPRSPVAPRLKQQFSSRFTFSFGDPRQRRLNVKGIKVNISKDKGQLGQRSKRTRSFEVSTSRSTRVFKVKDI